MRTSIKGAGVAGVWMAWLASSALAAGLSGNDFEQHFLSRLHHANLEEIQLGKLAQARSDSEDVKAYGIRLIQDHTRADRELLAFAKEHKIKIVEPVPPISPAERVESLQEQNEVTELRGLQGPAFDQKFKQVMVSDHRRDIDEVTQAIPKLPDKGSRDLAQSFISVLREHEKMADSLPEVG